ncbi:hypothetical protein IFM47457_02176 [Aspergillus lentulus]|nr:hypothetical protein IFM47457_02176 [Aspergillus lentulus]
MSYANVTQHVQKKWYYAAGIPSPFAKIPEDRPRMVTWRPLTPLPTSHQPSMQASENRNR